MNTTKAVLFDLDGTLVDTAPDLINALNLLLVEHGYPKVSPASVLKHVSNGSFAIIRAGLGNAGNNESLILSLQARYLEIYQANLSRHSKLFDGMETVLSTLDKLELPWGIVTNKPEYLTRPLLQDMNLEKRCCAIISGDTTTRSKPHPQPLLEACKRCNISANGCLYIGDDLRDIQAGNRAGMITLSAAWGYCEPEDAIERWPAQGSLQKPEDILHWL